MAPWDHDLAAALQAVDLILRRAGDVGPAHGGGVLEQDVGGGNGMYLEMRCRLSPIADVPSHTSGAAMGQSAAFGGTENAGRAATRTEHDQRLRLYPREPLQSLLSY